MRFWKNLSRGLSGRVFFFKIANELLENASAVLVILKLIETGAGRREQDDIAGNRLAGGLIDCRFEGAGVDDAAGGAVFARIPRNPR